ncbi:ATP-dependent DNA ligase [Bradyrhizobium sp. OAE829]
MPSPLGTVHSRLSDTPASPGWRGLVSKWRDSIYRSGRSLSWIEVKNRQPPAMQRVMEPVS